MALHRCKRCLQERLINRTAGVKGHHYNFVSALKKSITSRNPNKFMWGKSINSLTLILFTKHLNSAYYMTDEQVLFLIRKLKLREAKVL